MVITEIYWFILMIFFLVMEAGTVSLVSIWFAVGALVSMVLAIIGTTLWVQIGAFLLVSALLLACLMPLAKKYFNPKLTKTNVDSLVGRVCPVTAPIDNLTAQGEVKLGAMTWTARSSTGTPIPAGTTVRVDKIEGVKVFVTPVEKSTANV